jgi:hypothetical protein
MPGTAATANLRSGTAAPATGIYVVAHYQPSHASPHEVLIPGGTVLPECNICVDVRFSLKAYPPQPFQQNEFFRPKVSKP